MSSIKNEHDVLVGKTLHVYRYAIRQNKPVGVRQVQRALKFKSPTSASYHLAKLEQAGLLKQTTEGYAVEKLVLENYIKLRRLLIPKYMLLSLFFAVALIINIVIFRPPQLTRDFVFATLMIAVAMVSYAYLAFITLSRSKL
jgi:DNA-binding transcriptional ArsR family regulator